MSKTYHVKGLLAGAKPLRYPDDYATKDEAIEALERHWLSDKLIKAWVDDRDGHTVMLKDRDA